MEEFDRQQSRTERGGITPTKTWFKVTVPSAHVGAGRQETHDLYVFAKDPLVALGKAKRMRGWHRVGSNNPFPEIRELSREESEALQERISEIGIKLNNAKERGFYDLRLKE